MRSTGVVKFFSDEKGFGYILPDAGGPEVFMHRNDFVGELLAIRIPVTNQRVVYDLVDNNNRKGNGKKAASVEIRR